MAQVANNQDRFGGEYMIQDRDHMSEVVSQGARARQSQQSDSNGRQQGSNDQHESGQQGGERKRKSR